MPDSKGYLSPDTHLDGLCRDMGLIDPFLIREVGLCLFGVYDRQITGVTEQSL